MYYVRTFNTFLDSAVCVDGFRWKRRASNTVGPFMHNIHMQKPLSPRIQVYMEYFAILR